MRKSAFIGLLPMIVAIACQGSGDSNADQAGASSGQAAANATAAETATGTVIETMNSGGYTYAHIDTGKEKLWAAGPESEIAVGQRVSVSKSMPMREFKSGTLDRTFDVVYFTDSFAAGTGSAPASAASMPPGHPATGTPSGSAADQDFSKISRADGGHTVGELYAAKGQLGGQSVRVRGKVVKVVSGVMGRNWIHLQDGTGQAGTNDLTVTSQAMAKVGDTVLAEGELTLDKDFGSGYRYDLIIEDAAVTIE